MLRVCAPPYPPLEPPYADDVQAMLKRWMGSAPDREPLRLFRVLATHAELASRRSGCPNASSPPTVRGDADDPVWSERDALLLRLCDQLHDDADVTDELWRELERHWTHPQLLELIVTAGWYRLISQVLRSTRVEAEPWAARFPATTPVDGSR
jgi:4-carboxymuconolactone decarboxylase